jgi:hypothetical protein
VVGVLGDRRAPTPRRSGCACWPSPRAWCAAARQEMKEAATDKIASTVHSYTPLYTTVHSCTQRNVVPPPPRAAQQWSYSAFGVIGTTFRKLNLKVQIFFERADPITPNAWYGRATTDSRGTASCRAWTRRTLNRRTRTQALRLPTVAGCHTASAGLWIGLAPTLWGWPVWGEEWVFSVISYIAFSYLTRFWG